MSYDLFFEPRHGVFDPALFAEYFRPRKHYEADQRQAVYDNNDSGVYFIFNLGEPEEFEGQLRLSGTFNINYFRPSYFILEAEPEVTAFVRHFDMVVFDPQTDGMDEDDYQSRLLIRGWNSGNEYAYRILIKDRKGAGDLPTLPTATLIESWRWNLGRDERQSQFGDAKFVPRIAFLCIEGKADRRGVARRHPDSHSSCRLSDHCAKATQSDLGQSRGLGSPGLGSGKSAAGTPPLGFQG